MPRVAEEVLKCVELVCEYGFRHWLKLCCIMLQNWLIRQIIESC